jgi:hypothetical protein
LLQNSRSTRSIQTGRSKRGSLQDKEMKKELIEIKRLSIKLKRYEAAARINEYQEKLKQAHDQDYEVVQQ